MNQKYRSHLTLVSVACAVVIIACASPAPQQPSPSVDLSSWKSIEVALSLEDLVGQSVVLLGDSPLGGLRDESVIGGRAYPAFIKLGPGEKYERVYNDNRRGLPVGYAGRRGRIVEIETWGVNRTPIVRLDDTGERVGAARSHLGFPGVLERLKLHLRGKLWTKGTLLLFPEDSSPWSGVRSRYLRPETDQKHVRVGPLSRVEVLAVDWGEPDAQYMIRLRMPEGTTGRLFLKAPRDPNRDNPKDGRLEEVPPHPYVATKALALHDYFFPVDPKTLYPKWSEDIWTLLQQGQVAIGMNEDMVAAAAGPGLHVVGAQVNEKGESSVILACCGRKFLMRNGKVTGYVQQ